MVEKVTITIPTKNRIEELKITLQKLNFLIEKSISFIICDDGSTDGTSEFIRLNYPQINLIQNKASKGIHFVRNQLYNNVKTPYVISIDDDAHFITTDILCTILNYFESNEKVGIISFRAYWSTTKPKETLCNDEIQRVKSFGSVGFAMRMAAWYEIPNFLEWFYFYGEEDFAAYHLFKKGWEIHYIPEILVHHRVDLKARKKHKDYRLRLRRSLRAGWYLYFLFYPWKLIPRKMAYTIWMQLKLKVFKGDFEAGIAILQALGDLIINFPILLKNRKSLKSTEIEHYQKLSETKLYWFPEK